MNARKNRATLWAVYLTFFIDNLSWAVVFPLFAPFFLDPHNLSFHADTDLGTRTFFLGLFVTAFSLGQFLGAPLLGEYADKHGRKKALSVGVLGTLIGLAASALSMDRSHLIWLFLSRIWTGFFSSSTAVCLSCISDLSETEKEKVKNFGSLSVCAGAAFVLGAFLGGQLSDRSLSGAFSYSVPLWAAAAITFCNWLFVLFGFQETFPTCPSLRFHLWEAFSHLQVALQTKKIKRIYIVYFLFFFAWAILFQFIPALCVERFDFTSSHIGNLALFMGASWALASGTINKWLSSHFSHSLLLEGCLMLFTALCVLVIFPSRLYELLLLVGLAVIVGGLAWPISNALLSNSAPKEIQGKILGVSQSVQSLALTMGPVLAGFGVRYFSNFPFFLAAITCLFAVVVYYSVLHRRH